MSLRSFARRFPAVLALFVSSSSLVSGACECGYTVAIPDGPNAGQTVLFTDLIESDFLHEDDVMLNTDWAPQKFDVGKEAARGEYGQRFAQDNVVPNPIENSAKYSGPGINGGDAGISLAVQPDIEDGMVPGAEIATMRRDILYGTFRAGMKLTDVNGTCAAWFWYFNDTQEIDLEFLSREFDHDKGIYPVNLVLQSRDSASNGFDASETNNFVKANLTFDPTTDYHEYRIDFFESQVTFLADGKVLATMTGNAVPSHAGGLLMSHWSNGNELWSAGPPETKASVAVSYVKAYFNSSDTQRHSDWENRCQNIAANDATCAIPAVSSDDNDAATFFFSQQDNMTVNQTVSGQDSAAGRANAPLWSALVGSAILASGYVLGVL